MCQIESRWRKRRPRKATISISKFSKYGKEESVASLENYKEWSMKIDWKGEQANELKRY